MSTILTDAQYQQAHGLMLGTDWARMDEPGFCLKEVNQPAPDSKSVRRYQIITVVRNDRLAQLRRDLGRAKRFKASEFAIPGGVKEDDGRIYIEYTVGELVDVANHLRAGPFSRPDPPKARDLIGEYQDLPDKRQRQRKRLSTIGPVARIQRD